MSARDNVVPILIGLAVCGSIVTAGFIIRGNRAPDQATPMQPAVPANVPPASPEAASDDVKPVANWEQYIPTGRLIGPANAPLTLVVFADFQCPACRTLHNQLSDLRKEYPRDLAISYHYVPLPYHEMAYPAARAAECAAEQGRFEPYADKLYEHTESLAAVSFSDLAAQARVPDLPKFKTCVSEAHPVPRIENDQAAALGTLHIKGTPTVLVNGQMYYYAPKMAELKQMIDEARARAGAR
jgi:protein-disulfide isomerase